MARKLLLHRGHGRYGQPAALSIPFQSDFFTFVSRPLSFYRQTKVAGKAIKRAPWAPPLGLSTARATGADFGPAG